MPLASAPSSRAPADESPDMTVRVRGGPTSINLAWDALAQASVHLDQAVTTMQAQSSHLAHADRRTTPPAPTWRYPGFKARVGALRFRAGAAAWGLAEAVTGVDEAHEAYREVEAAAQRWMEALKRVTPWGQLPMLEAILEGNWLYARDYGAATIAMTLPTAAEASWLLPQGRAGRGAFEARLRVEAMMRAAGYGGSLGAETLLGEYELQVTGTEEAGAEVFDGTRGGFYETMAGYSDQGDVVVAEIDNGEGDPVYAVYIPGLDLDEHTAEDGLDPLASRGLLTTADAFANDSANVDRIVDQALRDAGAEEGADVMLSGFSQGGLAVTNLLKGSTTAERYSVRTADSLGAPATSEDIDHDAAIVHMGDRNDVVTWLKGGRNSTSSNRVDIDVDYKGDGPRAGSASGLADSGRSYAEHGRKPIDELRDTQDFIEEEGMSLRFQAHDFEHNLNIVREVDENPEKYLDEGQRQLAEEFAGLVRGMAKIYVSESEYRPG
ncbi:hypothetical protein [Nesterenkonia populi]